MALWHNITTFIIGDRSIINIFTYYVDTLNGQTTKKTNFLAFYNTSTYSALQPVSYFRCYNCFLLLVCPSITEYKFGRPATDAYHLYETPISSEWIRHRLSNCAVWPWWCVIWPPINPICWGVNLVNRNHVKNTKYICMYQPPGTPYWSNFRLVNKVIE